MVDRKYRRFPVKFFFTHWVDAAIAIAECNRSLLIDRHGVDPDKVHAIPNGVERPPQLSAEARARLRREWGAGPEEVLLGNVARLTARKGQQVLLRAFARLPAKFRLVLVGEGEDEAILRRAAQTLNIADRICFAGSRSDAASVPQAFDLFVLPSFVETMPLTVLEAMAGGTPVLASAVYGLPEILRHGETGWLVPAGDEDRLARALRELGEDRSLRKRLGAAGQAQYEAQFTARLMTERTAAIYLAQERTEERRAGVAAS
jgi:glycosyltransferase involved in cell wall biosynthesis